MYLKSSESWFSFILSTSESGFTRMSLNVVCCSVRTVFFVTFKSLAVQGTPFVSQIVLGFGMCYERRKSMTEIDLNDEIHQKTKKRHAKTQNSWHAKMQHLSPTRGIPSTDDPVQSIRTCPRFCLLWNKKCKRWLIF